MSNCDCSNFRRCGFTLLELMAVIVILSIATGITLAHVSSMTESAQIKACVAALWDLDARARLLSRSAPPTPPTLKLTSNGDGLQLIESESGEFLTPPHIKNATISLLVDSKAVWGIQFDAMGHSVDYTIHLERNGQIIELHFCGLTGWMVREDHKP